MYILLTKNNKCKWRKNLLVAVAVVFHVEHKLCHFVYSISYTQMENEEAEEGSFNCTVHCQLQSTRFWLVILLDKTVLVKGNE